MADRILRLAVLAATAMSVSAGCAVFSSSSTSSESSGSASSISDSFSDSSDSSSSSSGGDEGAALERDVSTYTALYTESGGDVDGYVRGIGDLCEQYAVSDWQRDPAVLGGIARGLADSRLADTEVGTLVAAISGDDAELRESLWAAIVALRKAPPASVSTLD